MTIAICPVFGWGAGLSASLFFVDGVRITRVWFAFGFGLGYNMSEIDEYERCNLLESGALK